MNQLIHPELSYQVRGVLIDVHNTLGPMLPEHYYKEAIAIGLEKRQVHKAQAISYLKVSNADLAIVVNFGEQKLQDERLPNYLRDAQPELSWRPESIDKNLLYPELSSAIYRACHQVHFTLGPGFLHQVYRRATMIELRRSALDYRYIKRVPIEYEDHLLGYQDTRLILVAERILLATFALRHPTDAAAVQLRTHMRPLNVKLGLLANFYGPRLNITPVRLT